MKKIILIFICLVDFGFAKLNNVEYNKTLKKIEGDPVENMVKREVSSKEVKLLIGKSLDSITKVKNIYQDSTNKKNVVYEYSVDTKKAKIQEALYDKFAIKLWEELLPNVCANEKIQIMMLLNVGLRYIYLDSNEKIIADMIIKKEDCDSLQ